MGEVKLSMLVTAALMKVDAIHHRTVRLIKDAGLYTDMGSDELRIAILAAARDFFREHSEPDAAAAIEASRLALLEFGRATDPHTAARAAAGLLAVRNRVRKRRKGRG